MEWRGLSTREWATVFWGVVVLVGLLVVPHLRSALAQLLRTFLQSWQIHLTLLAFLAWVVAVVYVGHSLGAWNRELLKDTVAWVVIYSFPTVFAALKAPKEDRFFRRAALATLSVTALMQFLLNLHTFSIWVELALLPIVTFILLVSTVATLKQETTQVSKVMDGLLGIIGIWVVLATAQGLWDSWRGLDPRQTGLSFAFSIWFPLAMLPFVYALALVMAYAKIFRLMPFVNDGRKPPLSVRAAVAVGLHGNLRAVNDVPQHHAQNRAISRSRGFRAALRNVREYEWAREQRRREKEIEAARLQWNAGEKGTRADGTMLDQREFEETKDALRWIHTCHMGHYNNLGRYRANLMDILGDFERQGLPQDHGITMRVSKNGQSWFAWRRTITGYVFAIGASEGTPSEWLYEGHVPPSGFPGQDRAWGDKPFNLPPNWM
jgi:hypothetical protein